MTEEVSTGGVMRFQYELGEKVGKLDDERKALIEQGYKEANERKKRERKNKIIFWGIIIFVLIITAAYFLLR